ncbi:MAG: hypothetical protein QNK92_06185 [Amylibacter sp.]
MKFYAPLLLAALFASPVTADTTELACAYKLNDPTNCVRFVGCVNNGDTHFLGRAHGWDTGALDGITSSGATCAGDWSYDDRINQGKGAMSCTDGNKTGFSFFSRDGKVQAFTGVIISEDGDRMSMWTGGNLLNYFAEKFPDQTEPGFLCGENWVPFSASFLKTETD